MTTLHALRRQHALPFSELARLTGVPVRRLAAFEYHNQPLSPQERHQLAAFFGVSQTILQDGTIDRTRESLRTAGSPQVMATLAVAATIALSLRLHAPATGLPQQTAIAPHQAVPAAVQQPVAAADLLVQPGRNRAATQPLAMSGRMDAESPARSLRDERVINARSNNGQAAADDSLSALELRSIAREPLSSLGRSSGADESVAPIDKPADESIAPVDLQSITFAPAGEPPRESPVATPELTPEPTLLPTPTPESMGIGRMGTSAKRIPVIAKAAPAALVVPSSATPGVPDRCPLAPSSGRVAISQGYDVGTHAPAHLWGGLDLATSGGATEGTPVIATHAGYVQVALDSWPGGNFVSLTGDAGWRTGYAHLKDVFVYSGQYVEAGTVIGSAGSTGSSTGPHLHYETWRNGVNVNPAPVLNCR